MQVLGASETARGKTVQHRLEMKGSIPPWVLDRLTGVIKDAHPAKFQVGLYTNNTNNCNAFQHRLDACSSRLRLPGRIVCSVKVRMCKLWVWRCAYAKPLQ